MLTCYCITIYILYYHIYSCLVVSVVFLLLGLYVVCSRLIVRCLRVSELCCVDYLCVYLFVIRRSLGCCLCDVALCWCLSVLLCLVLPWLGGGLSVMIAGYLYIRVAFLLVVL
jgi:hypothetical protein